MVILDQGREGLLEDVGAQLQVGKRGEDLGVDQVQGLFPVAVERPDDLGHPALLLLQRVGAGAEE